MPASVTPYLFFDGRCEEALDFYKRTLGATVDMLMRFNESPDPVPADKIQPGYEKKVMHTTFRIGDSLLHGSDGCGPGTKFQNFSLSLTMPTEVEAKKVFTALSDGGSVTLPIAKTFWSPCFGMLTDKYGLGWMVTVPM